MIKDRVLISAGVTIRANNIIEDGSLIALGAKVVSWVRVTKDVLVGAGAVVINNIEANTVVFGIPVKSKK